MSSNDFDPAVFYNGTPHPISIFLDGTKWLDISSHGNIRLSSETSPEPQAPAPLVNSGIRFVAAPKFNGILGLPEYKEGIAILVSMPVGDYLARCPELWPGPVLGPDTSPTGVVRDSEGRIIGTKSLVVYKQ